MQTKAAEWSLEMRLSLQVVEGGLQRFASLVPRPSGDEGEPGIFSRMSEVLGRKGVERT